MATHPDTPSPKGAVICCAARSRTSFATPSVTPPRISEVTIEIGKKPGAQPGAPRIVIRVRDHGPGVPPAALANLFRPFYRVSEARDRLSGGTGLGLAITRQAVQAHAGTVSAVNHPAGGFLVEIELDSLA